ncbi:hypothetical protein V7S43_011204 [Phytophthora oleae]|uniref:Uncharacterized protein n=1 Tax=Phytophthora oleae TaxID=2107226 RepID=A0ABD3FE69_9STRA
MLPGAVAWKEVRPDLRQALLAGVSYDKSMEWLSSDKAAQNHFRGSPLVTILVSMMFWRRLNQSPWTCYVPETNCKMADEKLDCLVKSGEQPAARESLDSHVPYPESDVESTVDNTKKNPDYKDSAAAHSETEDEESSKRSRDDVPDDPDSDDGPIVPTKKPKKSGGSVVTKSSSKSSSKSRTSPRSKSSGSKSSSEKSRRQSRLVSKPYMSLSVKELQVVETPDCDTTSWMCFRIRLQRVSATKTTTGQTLGFPEYEVHKHSSPILK